MKRFLSPDEAKLKYPLRTLVRDFGAFLRPYRGRFALASVIRLAGDLAWLYPAFALATIVTFLTTYTPGESLRPVWLVLAFWMLAVLVRATSQLFSKYLCYQIGERMALDSQERGINHLFLLDMAWHERENAGSKLKRIQNGSQGLDRIARVWINNIIEIGVNFVGTIFIISRFDHIVAGVMFVFLVTQFTLSFFLVRRAAAAAYAASVKEEEATGIMFEAVSNIRSVKAMAMMRSLGFFIARALEELFEKIRIRIFRFQLRASVLQVWSMLFKLGTIAFIILGIAKGRYELGFLILFNGYFNEIWGSVIELSDVSQEITVARYGIARMNETLREPVTIDREEGKIPFPNGWKTIALDRISFSYGDNVVLDDVSFGIRRGEKIGIVGLSGAGKSTLFKLLLKEYETQKGEISFDGASIKDISKSDYFKYVSVVLQDTEVFNLSLEDNIVLANPDEAANAALLEQAMNVAHVSDFLHKLPSGADTLIGEKGIKLSGGEKQRLGIARAIFKRPQILLLDEATSHLDLESEEKIRESLHKFFKGVTALVIAHRLTTIREMDKIFLIEDGVIKEAGSFDELYRKRGRFYELWEKQRL